MPPARVSVLLPTYNRARFLPAALDAIQGQSFTDWELVVVDDGSTDGSAAIVADRTATWRQSVRVVTQANAGAYAARNTALDHATGPYVAFYDSDDLWLSHHLTRSVEVLDRDAGVDWVYASCRIVDHVSERLIDPDTFRVRGVPRPFLSLATRPSGRAWVIDDPRDVAWALRHGLYCGLQNSVIRATVFSSARFHADYRNEAEDQLFVIRALKAGRHLAYIDDVHVEYHVHDSNSSAAARGGDVDRELAVYRLLVRGFEDLRREFTWTRRESRELARRIARDRFWHIGYALLWSSGRRGEALEAFRAGLREWPWSPACWKTYLAARIRTRESRAVTSRVGP